MAIDEPFVAEPLRHHPPRTGDCHCGIVGEKGGEARHAPTFRGETRVNPNHDAKGLFAAADSGGSTGGVGGAGKSSFSNADPGLTASEQAALIRSIVRSKGDKGPQKYRLVDRPEAERLKKETGLDLSGCVHSAGKSEINHILSGHGEGNEWREGQSPITEDDLAMVPEIVAHPDSTKLLERKPKDRHEQIRHQKRVDGHIFAVEEVRVGGRAGGQLALKSMHKVATSAAGAGTT